jgi:hypothetical protein
MNGNHGVGVVSIKQLDGEETFEFLPVARDDFFITFETQDQGTTFGDLGWGEFAACGRFVRWC